jgi:hypothetical protein
MFSCVYTLRSPRNRAFTSDETRLVWYLAPHLQTAARIYQRIANPGFSRIRFHTLATGR